MRTKTIERKRLPPTISKLARGERKGERFLLPNDPRGKEKGGENRKSGADGSGCSKLGSEKKGILGELGIKIAPEDFKLQVAGTAQFTIMYILRQSTCLCMELSIPQLSLQL